MDNAGRPTETAMIGGEPYSVEDLLEMQTDEIEWDIWYLNLSGEDQFRVNQMLAGKDWREVE